MRKYLYVLLFMFICSVLCTPIIVEAAKKDNKKPTVKLIQQEKKWTKKSVKISVNAKDKSGIKKILWQKGKIKKSKPIYWYGAKNISKKRYFMAPKNGWYSVKVIDKKGNSKINRVKIINIDKQGPTGNWNYYINNKVATIKVSASDPRGVSELRWCYGYITSRYATQFPNKIVNNTFAVNRNGYCTIWAKDSLGNVTLVYVYVNLWTDLTSLSIFDQNDAGLINKVV